MIYGNKATLSDEELEMLARAYIKLRKKQNFKRLSKNFKEYIDDYLKKEISDYLLAKESK